MYCGIKMLNSEQLHYVRWRSNIEKNEIVGDFLVFRSGNSKGFSTINLMNWSLQN